MARFLRKKAPAQRSAPRPQSDPRVIAVFQSTDSGFVGAVAKRNGHSIEVLECKEFGKNDASAAAWAQELLASRCVLVLPSASVIVRAVQLPRAPEDKLQSALELNATTFVLGRTPEFRVGSALLQGERGEDGVRTGVVAEWPIDQPTPALPHGAGELERINYSPEVAALAALAGAGSDPLVAIDMAHGTVSVAAPSSKGIMVRIVRAGGDDGGINAQEIGRAVGEACVHAEVPASEVAQIMERTMDAARACLSGGFGCTDDTLRKLSNAIKIPAGPDTAEWWRKYGVIAGTAWAAFGPSAALTQLQSSDPGARPDRAGVVLNRMAEPRTAARLVVAALVAIAIGPLVFQGMRLLVLKWKLPDLAAYTAAESADDQRRTVYRMLSRNAASMTKTLSDLGATAPQGVEFDFINIAQGVKGQSVTVRGRALPIGSKSASDTILEMEQLLRKSTMFVDITRSSEPPHQGGITDFTVNAVAVRPTEMAAYPEEQDYAKKSLRERIYGPPPADVDWAAEEADAKSTGTNAPTRTTSAGGSTNGGSTNGGSTNGTGAGTTNGSSGTASASRNGSSRRDHSATSTSTSTSTGTEGSTTTAPPGAASASHSADGKVADGKPTDTKAGDSKAADATRPPPPPPSGAAADGAKDAKDGAKDGAKEENKEGEEGKDSKATRTPRTGSGGLATRGTGLGGQGSAPEPAPEPITEAEINAMSKTEAQAKLAMVAKARQRADLSEEVLARLKSEFDLLLARCRRD